ncbi:NUDIX domain-containing protein, partial [Limosilactobacillus mucosae]
MSEEIIARPLITITNIIWSFNRQTHEMQLLLIKRSEAPFKDAWALPETLLRSTESADDAALRLIKDKIGLEVRSTAT